MARMKYLISGIYEKLADVLSQVSFSHYQADYRESPHWAVYAHPWESEEEGYFDVLITVIPRSPAAGTGEGIRLTVERSNATWLPERETNDKGEIWFKQLPLGNFRARLAEVTVDDALQASALIGAPAVTIAPEATHIYYPAERRIIALLERGQDGRAVLTIETEMLELAGAVVRYSVGGESGKVILQRQPDRPNVWRGSGPLRHTFDDIETSVPDFTVVPPLPQQEGE